MIGSSGGNDEFPLECPLAKLGRSSPLYQHSNGGVANSLHPQHHSIKSTSASSTQHDINTRLNEVATAAMLYRNCHNRSIDESVLRNQTPSVTSHFERYHISSNQSSHHRYRQQIQPSPSEHSTAYHYTTAFIQRTNVTHPSCNYIVEHIDKLGRSSPSFDQGYHTLVSPSPGPSTPRSWICQQQTTQTSNNNSSHLPLLMKGKISNQTSFRNNCFSILPDSVILRIFACLNSCELCVCAQVCRRFEHLVWMPSMWKTIILKGANISGDKAIRNIIHKLCMNNPSNTKDSAAIMCSTIERVFVLEGARLTDKGLTMLARCAPELTHLQIQSCAAITNIALLELVSRCHNLQHLDVTGCTKLTTLATPALSNRKLMLQYLDLTDCSSIDDNGLRTIVVNCPQLVYLYLRRCIQITDAGIKCVPSFCAALRELSVSDCTNLTDFGLYELAKLGATLRYLSVAKCDRVSDPGLKVIVRRCYKLRYLNARGCEAVSDDAITVLARSCPRLRALDIGKCDVTDNGLRQLAESCPNLKKLSLRNCELITDKGVQFIAYYCRGLQLLNIQDCQITIEGYRAVKKFCKRCVIEHTNPGFF